MPDSPPVRLEVELTDAHIGSGVRESCEKCPIALAVIASRPDITGAEVYAREGLTPPFVSTCVDGHYYELALPWKAEQFMKAFDRGWPVKPITFELESDERKPFW